MCEEFPDIAGCIEVSGNALGATADRESQTIEVRLLDTATGAISQVAVTQNYGRFQWSPDGRVLAVGRSSQVISFIDLQGRVLATNAAGGLPDAWIP